MIEGADVSHFETIKDWTKLKQNESFLFCKATQALNFKDPKFNSDWVQAKASGIKRGAYHVLDMRQDPIIQAQYFCTYVKAAGIEPGDMLALDWEQSVNKSVYGGADACMKFLGEVKALTGITPLYYGSYYETQDMKFPVEAAQYPLWLARYGVESTPAPAPWKNWTLWQFSENTQVPGIGGCDENYFNGTLQDLAAL